MKSALVLGYSGKVYEVSAPTYEELSNKICLDFHKLYDDYLVTWHMSDTPYAKRCAVLDLGDNIFGKKADFSDVEGINEMLPTIDKYVARKIRKWMGFASK